MTKWCDQNVAKLKALWDEGHSASVIADRIGNGFSRCSILGKVHRLGLTPRSAYNPPGGKTKRRHGWMKRKENPPAAFSPFKERRRTRGCPPAPVTTGRGSIIRLRKGECRYPREDGTYCAAPQREGSSYCAHHHWICTVPFK